MSDRVVFERLAPDVRLPERSTAHSAGYDIRAHLAHGPVRIYRSARDEIIEELPRVRAARGSSETPESSAAGGSLLSLVLEPADRALIPTGFRARLPEGYEGQIRMRSSLAWQRGLIVPNAPGTVDADYPDEWFVLVLNASRTAQEIRHGERVAQLVLNRHEVLPWVDGDVEVTTDRLGGLGSTG